MKGKAFYCSNCRKKIGTHFSNASLSNIKEKYQISDNESSATKESDAYANKIESEQTDTFGRIVKIPCRRCGEDNFLDNQKSE